MTLDFKIGATTAGLKTLKMLTTPVLSPHWDFDAYSDEVLLGNGLMRGMGWPNAEWHWGYMTQAQYDQLKTFCSGKSASVYIVTKTDNDSFATYGATLIWPAKPQMGNLKVYDVTLKFIALEAV